MQLTFLSYKEELQKQKVSLIKYLNQQIIKDFEMSSIPLGLDRNFSFENTLKTLLFEVRNLLNNDYERLLNLLYRIDINEEKMKNPFNYSIDEYLTFLIIQREWQKVWLKYQMKE